MTRSKKCPTKHKRTFDTQAEAQKAANGLYSKLGKAAGAQKPYRCPAGHWHVGSAAVKARQPWMKAMSGR